MAFLSETRNLLIANLRPQAIQRFLTLSNTVIFSLYTMLSKVSSVGHIYHLNFFEALKSQYNDPFFNFALEIS